MRGKIVLVEEEPLVCFDGRKTCSPTTIWKRNLASQKLVMIFLYSFQGFATTFIINQMVDNNGVFPREAISTLCRLAGWSEKGGTWALYI